MTVLLLLRRIKLCALELIEGGLRGSSERGILIGELMRGVQGISFVLSKITLFITLVMIVSDTLLILPESLGLLIVIIGIMIVSLDITQDWSSIWLSILILVDLMLDRVGFLGLVLLKIDQILIRIF